MNFSFLLKTLTNSLPDDDSQLSVFDYYVDESGEWDVWQSRWDKINWTASMTRCEVIF